eukprot:6882313-Prymnesium_polylepis.1
MTAALWLACTAHAQRKPTRSSGCERPRSAPMRSIEQSFVGGSCGGRILSRSGGESHLSDSWVRPSSCVG